MKKKIAIISLIMVVCLILASCGQQAAAPEAPAETKPAETKPAETKPAETTPAAPAASEQWPNQPITLYVGFSAGGSSDLQARYVAAALGDILGTSVVVENVPGSAGALCYNKVLTECAKDGYSFCLANMPAMDMGKYDEANPRSFSVDDFELICNHVTDYNVLAIRNDETRFTDLASIVDYSQNNTILIGAAATGITSDDATIMQKLGTELGLKYDIVPTGGSKETETLFIQGNTDILIANVADVRTAHESGQYKVLCVFAEERSDMLPDVPAFAELGFDCDPIVNFSARGYAFAKGVDSAIVAKMAEALEKAINDPKVMEQMTALGAEIDFRGPEEYNALIEADIASGCKAFGVQP